MKIVTAALLIKDRQIFIARRNSIGLDPERWEFPGGTVEFGETPEQCLQRKLQEEFRMNINVGDLFGESAYEYGQGTTRLMAFRANWGGGDIIATAHDEFKWVDIGDLRNYYFAPADIPIIEKLMREHRD